MITLLDDTTVPTVRQTIGRFMATACFADFAVANVRLAAIDLQTAELAGIERLRLLLARFDATFAADAHVLRLEPERAAQLETLLDFVESGHVEVRSTGSALWLPDFSVYRQDDEHVAASDRLLLGAHYFRELFTSNGTALTCIISDAGAVQRASARFEWLWEYGHDIQPVIAETLRDALQCGTAS